MPSSATTEIYTLSLHDALPIFVPEVRGQVLLQLPELVRLRQEADVADLRALQLRAREVIGAHQDDARVRVGEAHAAAQLEPVDADRKSTRLNSSHVEISYAVFCHHRDLHSFPTRRSSDLCSRGTRPGAAPAAGTRTASARSGCRRPARAPAART